MPRANVPRGISNGEWNIHYKCRENADRVIDSLRSTGSALTEKTKETILRKMQAIKEPRYEVRTREGWVELIDGMKFTILRESHRIGEALDALAAKKKTECDQRKQDLKDEQQKLNDEVVKGMALETKALNDYIKSERARLQTRLYEMNENRKDDTELLNGDCRNYLNNLKLAKKGLPARKKAIGQKNLGI